MSSLIDEAFRASQEALTSVYGGDIEIIPMAGGEYLAIPDPNRQPVRIVATLMTQVEAGTLKGQKTGQGSEFQGAASVMTDDPQLWVDANTILAMPWQAKHGDIVRAHSKPGVPEFTILSPMKGDRGDILFILTRGAARRPTP